MSGSQLPNSLRKFLRREKSRIRRDVLSSSEAEQKVKELVEKVFARRGKMNHIGRESVGMPNEKKIKANVK